MKLSIAIGCVLLASTSFAQQSKRKPSIDSVRTIDNMPVISDTGNPVPMPTRKGSGTVVAMPTRRIGAAETPEEISRKGVELLEEQLKDWRMDSSGRVNPRKKER